MIADVLVPTALVWTVKLPLRAPAIIEILNGTVATEVLLLDS